jgi:hypothetical protein
MVEIPFSPPVGEEREERWHICYSVGGRRQLRLRQRHLRRRQPGQRRLKEGRFVLGWNCNVDITSSSNELYCRCCFNVY